MSTRAQIGYEGEKVYVYKHSDGYPEKPGILPVLIPFRDHFFKWRRDDGSYFLARLVAHLSNEHDRDMDRMTAGEPKSAPSNYDHQSRLIGIGVDTVKHWDIEWFYRIRKNGTIEVNRCHYREDKSPRLELVASIPLDMDYEAAVKLIRE